MRTCTMGQRVRQLLAPPSTMGLVLLASVGTSTGLVGCGGLEPVAQFEPTVDPSQLYMSLVLNHRAITLSTVPGYDTLRLVATPLDAAGAPLAGLPAPVFTSSDTANLLVTPDGFLEARGVVTGVKVSVSVTIRNIKHVDTAVVNVNTTGDSPPVLTSLSLDPDVTDSTIRALSSPSAVGFAVRGGPFRSIAWILAPVVRDGEGNPIPDLVVESLSLDSAVATIPHFSSSPSTATVQPHRPGTVRVVARATAYGVTQVDTVVLTVTWPVVQMVEIGSSEPGHPLFFPRELRLAPHGLVGWVNWLESDGFDIVFDDTTNVARPPAIICDRFVRLPDDFGPGEHCGTGNFVVSAKPLAASLPNTDFPVFWTTQVRQFPVPGVYTYHSTRAGFTGRIIVTTDPDPTALP